MCIQLLLHTWRLGGGFCHLELELDLLGLSSRGIISPILTARGASYHMKRTINRACVQYIELTYGTETWVMKTENLPSLERMMVK